MQKDDDVEVFIKRVFSGFTSQMNKEVAKRELRELKGKLFSVTTNLNVTTEVFRKAAEELTEQFKVSMKKLEEDCTKRTAQLAMDKLQLVSLIEQKRLEAGIDWEELGKLLGEDKE